MNEKHVDKFTVRYAGAAVDDHTIDAALLAHALLAFEEINRITYAHITPGERQVKTKLTATRGGSFCFDLSVTHNLFDSVRDLFSPDLMEYGANLATAATPIAVAIAWGVKKIKAKACGKPQPQAPHHRLDRIANDLAADPHFIQRISDSLRLLRDDNVEIMELYSSESEKLVSVDPVEARAIDNLTYAPDETHIFTVEDLVKIDTPQLEKPLERKWRFISAEYGVFTAFLSDDDFASDVAEGKISFARGKIFKVKLRISQQGNKTSYEVLTVEDANFGDQNELPI